MNSPALSIQMVDMKKRKKKILFIHYSVKVGNRSAGITLTYNQGHKGM